eukprot:2376497-Amphidinium_carterae.1
MLASLCQVKYVADEGEVVIHVRHIDENEKQRPVRGSPFKATFTKNSKQRANDYTGVAASLARPE